MGGCSGKQQGGNIRQNQKQNIKEEVIKATENDKNITRRFTVVFANIKVKNPPTMQNIQFQVNFDNQHKYSASLAEKDDYLRWEGHYEFNYQSNDYNLKEHSFIIIYLKNQLEELLGYIKLNLYKVATGPYHHDLAVKWTNHNNKEKQLNNQQKNEGRISFDLKMFQKINFQISVDNVIACLEDHLTDKAYNFSFRIITSNSVYHSEHSTNFINPAYNNLQELEYYENLNIQQEDFNSILINEGIEKKNLKVEQYNKNHLNESRLKNESVQLIKNNTDIFNNNNTGIFAVPSKRFNKDFKPITLPILNENTEKFIFLDSKSQKVQTVNKDMTHIKSLFISDQKQLTKQQKNDENEEENIQKHNLTLFWDYLTDLTFQRPFLNIELTTNELTSTSLQICIWGIENIQAQEKVDINGNIVKYMDNHISGECYVSLNRILSITPEIKQNQEGNQQQIRQKNIKENLWSHGIQVGRALGQFKIQNHEYLRQLIVGVATENGIMKASPSINQGQENSKTNNINVQVLIDANDKFITSVFNLYQKKQDLSDEERLKMFEEIKNNYKVLFELAQKSHKESITSFYYKTEEELLKAQLTIIELEKHLIMYADDVDEQLKDNYYELLKLVINRGEFNLSQMCFDDSYSYLLIANNHTQKKRKKKQKIPLKLEVALNYQYLLYIILEKVLDKLNQKALSLQERQFVENFCAIAYFRIPEFRQKLLKQLTKQEDPQIQEWRGTEYKLDEQENLNLIKNKEFLKLFDWDNEFFKYIKGHQKAEDNYLKLTVILDNQKWCQRIQKRGIAFFFLSQNGYNMQIKLLQQKIKYLGKIYLVIQHYQKLFFVYDSVKVVAVFDMINDWLERLILLKKNIPTIFDFNFFFKGIRMIINSHNSISISRVLWVLYNNYQLFPSEFQNDLCQYLLSNIFFKLYMHWSFNVRMIFHYFLIYRIFHINRDNISRLVTIEEINKEILLNQQNQQLKNKLIDELIYLKYQQIMEVLEVAKIKYQQQQLAKQREVSLHQKMRQKINKKKDDESITISSPAIEYQVKNTTQQNLASVSSSNLNEIIANQSTDDPKQNNNNELTSLLEIEAQHLKYIPIANFEFDELMKKYNDWYENKLPELNYLLKDQRIQVSKNYAVPEVVIRNQIDESEAQYGQSDEW
ncbi:hypothetical protein IMG5_145140 [Ichthyophthirius multifiliis]|uniref:Uncharacterized protein n=1 Tax=Ichthyophthirius multifiliis TaxID=5932 RepID=G0QXT4_ICHMU|nr:hypothetical protein IMG5_145140 [Ichthyophthirius multifiliis]EGR29965.1 hypothetical protein IMG5_145140 [Ichthyophthirius multifiliis]|eukprot:XP_004031201.1 hypothetical protein IMG5_145140 [Ichthyophthirius multifiliis]